jgi:hypothetical protein
MHHAFSSTSSNPYTKEVGSFYAGFTKISDDSLCMIRLHSYKRYGKALTPPTYRTSLGITTRLTLKLK